MRGSPNDLQLKYSSLSSTRIIISYSKARTRGSQSVTDYFDLISTIAGEMGAYDDQRLVGESDGDH